MKIYIAGPMSELPQNNFPAFDSAATVLRAIGHDVISPAELDDAEDRARALADEPATKTWGDFLARDVKLIADGGVQAICLLPGWEGSRGARLEAIVGLLCDLSFYRLNKAQDLVGLHRTLVAVNVARTFAK